MFRTGKRSISPGDQGSQLIDNHLSVGVSFAASEPFVLDRGVLVDALNSGVINADDHQRLDFTGGDHGVSRFADAPIVALDEGRLRVKQVLAVVQEEHWEKAVGLVEEG